MNTGPLGKEIEGYDSCPPERFVVEVFSELPAAAVQERWQQVNVILRLSILTGLQMELEATLNLLCDLAAEMVSYERALLYFWDDSKEQAQLCAARNVEDLTLAREELPRGNVLNFWATKYGRPLLVWQGHNLLADSFLRLVEASSALVVPLFVSNRVMGTMQLFTSRPEAFSSMDAQLLWILSLVAENQLTREYANEGLIRFAFTDFLTGLKTRGYFEQQLEAEIKRSERKKQKLALLMVDIDFFKQLNDQYGHHVGDQILRDVASLLMKDMREVDTVARYGGEEFVIILPETHGQGALFVAQRLRRTIEQAKFFAGSPDSVERLTISIGVSVFGDDAASKRTLIENSDAALYAAKRSGRNKVVLSSDIAPEQREVS
jgi:diguanylate cyclase (GGDEF)-like protein